MMRRERLVLFIQKGNMWCHSKHFLFLGIVAMTAIGSTLSAQSSLEAELRTNGKKTVAVFEPYRQVLQASSAVIYRGYKRVVYGVVMSEDGYILTKASELEEPFSVEAEKEGGVPDVKPLSVRVGEDDLYENIEVVAIDVKWDIALLKIEASGLTPITFATDSNVSHGSWVMANGATSRSRRRVRVGIVAANSREIVGVSPVVMGVTLEESEGKLFIRGISKDSGAEVSGLAKDDVIVKIDGQPIATREKLVEIIEAKEPGDILRITYLRDGKEAEAMVELMARPSAERSEAKGGNDAMSGRFSRRRDGFERVLQVDIPMQEHSCGGPVLNFAKECIGLVIARANRAETFVMPCEEVQQVYAELRSRAK